MFGNFFFISSFDDIEYLFLTIFLNSCFLSFTVLYSNLDFVVNVYIIHKICLFFDNVLNLLSTIFLFVYVTICIFIYDKINEEI